MIERTIFQKIWDAEVPSYPLYRNDSEYIGLMAILDVFAATRGHTLIVPTEAVDSWDDLPPHREEQATRLGGFIRQHLMRTLDPRPIRIAKVNIGSQVPHVHDQFIPMYERGDTQKLWLPERVQAPRPEEELIAVHAQVTFPEELATEADLALTQQSPFYRG